MKIKYVISREGCPDAVLLVRATSMEKAMDIKDKFVSEYDGEPIKWICAKSNINIDHEQAPKTPLTKAKSERSRSSSGEELS